MLDLPLRVVKEAILSPLAAILPPHPNAISIVVDAIAVTDSQVGFLLGMASCWFCAQANNTVAVSFWILNRIVDGVDGTVARKYSMQTDYGGYLDIIVDFTVYASIPIALCIGYHQSVFALAIVAALEGIYFVNCASLFQLSAILEKRSQGSKSKKELTTVTMPPALIEGHFSLTPSRHRN
jgi:phosphatidylglycerophosphate synthase